MPDNEEPPDAQRDCCSALHIFRFVEQRGLLSASKLSVPSSLSSKPIIATVRAHHALNLERGGLSSFFFRFVYPGEKNKNAHFGGKRVRKS